MQCTLSLFSSEFVSSSTRQGALIFIPHTLTCLQLDGIRGILCHTHTPHIPYPITSTEWAKRAIWQDKKCSIFVFLIWLSCLKMKIYICKWVCNVWIQFLWRCHLAWWLWSILFKFPLQTEMLLSIMMRDVYHNSNLELGCCLIITKVLCTSLYTYQNEFSGYRLRFNVFFQREKAFGN